MVTPEIKSKNFSWDIHSSIAVFPFLLVSTILLTLPIELWGNSKSFFEDDLFYYIEIARNFSRGKGFTFDGISQTNGFQFLWQILLVPVVKFGSFFGEFGPLAATVAFNMGIIVLTLHITLGVLSRVVPRKEAAFITSISYLIAMPYVLNGMETSLTLLLLVSILNSLQKLMLSPSSRVLTIVVSGMTAILIPARMDLIPVTIGVIALLFFIGFTGAAIFTAACSAIVALTQIIFSYALVGSVLPVSSLVKSWWRNIGIGGTNPETILGNFWKIVKIATKPINDVFLTFSSETLAKSTWDFGAIFLASILFLSICRTSINLGKRRYFISKMLDSRDTDSVTILYVVILSSCCIIQISYYSLFTSGMWTWYYGFPSVLFLLVTLTVIFRSNFLEFLRSRKSLAVVSLVFITGITGITGITTFNSVQRDIENGSWGQGILDLDSWLDENVPNNATVGTWAAGELGYLRDGRVVNL